MGLNHDFNTDANGARDASSIKTCTIKTSPDNKCTNIGSIMDYDQVRITVIEKLVTK